MATYKFVVFRLINRLVTLLFLAIVSFFLFEVIPQLLGFNVAFLFAGITQLSPKQAQAQLLLVDTIAKAYGLYDPLPLRIYHFLFNMFTFNFGYSPTFKEPVLKVVSQYLPNSLILSGVSLITTSVLSIVFGVYAAKSFINSKKKNRRQNGFDFLNWNLFLTSDLDRSYPLLCACRPSKDFSD